jgi:hypothetical protein
MIHSAEKRAFRTSRVFTIVGVRDGSGIVGKPEVIQIGSCDEYREVGISSGNQALTRCAFLGTYLVRLPTAA